ncbi:hypothetical protein GQX74_006631 [Glossina fuscipes]|nr:hypothetical protein GQX74_006631 [Glossina fuscipes]
MNVHIGLFIMHIAQITKVTNITKDKLKFIVYNPGLSSDLHRFCVFKMASITKEDYDAFCLAYMFTYRDFEMGTLGLAWTGDLKNAGGVCEKNGLPLVLVSSLAIALISTDQTTDEPNVVTSSTITILTLVHKYYNHFTIRLTLLVLSWCGCP